MKVVVVGGGASGLAAAIFAARNGNQVTILEKNNKCGKKLLLTGNGHCNFWNEEMTINHFHSQNMELAEEIIKQGKEEILPFFSSLGIIPKIINGYYYPYTKEASTIYNALLRELKDLNVDIVYETEVVMIKKKDMFILETTKSSITADAVILATGSKAYPKTGSDGSGYLLAKALGHTIIPVLPSLVQLIGINPIKQWAGVRTGATLTLYTNGKKGKEEPGELQLTEYGLSGICTFNLSGLIAKELYQHQNVEIKINFVPWFKGTKEQFGDWMSEQSKKRTIGEILEGFLNYKIVLVLLKKANLSYEEHWSKEKEKLISLLLEFPYPIKETKSELESQVCSGGIPLTEINPNTMESKKVKGLYITGELLDVDGDCGGYNLGFAWISAFLAGTHIQK